MADNIISSFLVALGFDDAAASSMVAKTKKSLADYERAVKEAEKRIEDAKWEGAKTQEEIAKLTRETNLKEARAALASAQEREKSEKETARKREERNKEFMSGLNKAALAATAAATAIGYAVTKVAGAFDNLGFVSQRTGASVQSLNSLGYAFKQTGGSAQQAVGAVEKFAQALRSNDGLKGMVKGLGVDTTKDMSEVYLNTIEALSKHEYQVGSREAGLFGISEEDYKLVTDHLRQIREYRDEYNRTTRSLGIDSQKAAEASQSFWRSLNKLQATASALTDKLMISLAPALEAIVKRFNDWIETHPEQVNKILTDISNGLTYVADKFSQFADWMIGGGGDELLKRWDDFAKRVERVAKGIELIAKAAAYIGFNSGTREYLGRGDPGATAALVDQAGADKRNIWQRTMPKFLGGKDAPDPGDVSGGKASRQKGENKAGAKESYDFWRSKGLDHAQAAGLVGMEEGESNFNPRAVGDGGRAHGAFQHHPDRRAAILKGAGIDIDRATHRQQLEAAYWEMTQGNEKEAWAAIKRAKTPGASASAGVYKFERPLDKAGEAFRRGQRANYWSGVLGSGDAPAATPAPRGAATPGAFDPNNIDPKNLMPPAPSAASPTTNNSTSTRAVHQTINNTTTITGTDRPKEAARVMESAFGRMHGLALQNAQSAVA